MERKRKRKQNDYFSNKRKETKEIRNPFLKAEKLEKEPAAASTDGRVLKLVLTFIDLNKKDAHRLQDGKVDPGSLQDVVRTLCSFLENERAKSFNGVSRADIAKLLLPWCSKNLVYIASSVLDKADSNIKPIPDTKIHWQALSTCLDELTQDEDESAIGTDIVLSQSALNKIVPFAAFSCLFSEADDEVVRKASSNAYRIMLEKLYRPTADLAFTNLLPKIAEYIKSSPGEEGSTTKVTNTTLFKEQIQVVVSTLNFLHYQQKQGSSNPKKIFQLLAQRPVMWAVSCLMLVQAEDQAYENQKLVHNLLWEGFFSPLHHMEGFRSVSLTVPTKPKDTKQSNGKDGNKNQTKSFRCYQENLLDSALGVIRNNESKEDEVIPFVRLIPVLIEGFIDQSSALEKGGSSRPQQPRKGHSRTSATPLQFRFWSNLIWVLLERLKTPCLNKQGENPDERPDSPALLQALVQAIRDSLALASSRDVYLPSFEDKEGIMLDFLRLIAESVMDIIQEKGQAYGPGQNSQLDETECLDLLESLKYVVGLNHLVVHERLPEFTLAGVKCGMRHSPTSNLKHSNHVWSLLRTLATTYNRLRQVDYLVRSILSAANSLATECTQQSQHTLQDFRQVIKKPEVTKELSVALRNVPHGQIRPIFQSMSSWITSNYEHLAESDEKRAQMEAISLATDLFVLIAKNVQVNQHTAKNVSTLCNMGMTECVSKLCDPKHSPESNEFEARVAKDGIVLCGWFVNLQTRCQFWLGEISDGELVGNRTDASNVFLPILTEASSSNPIGNADGKQTNKWKPVFNELRFLGCFRVQQLHSLIYEERRKNMVTNSGCDKMSSRELALKDEAQRTVAFILGPITEKESCADGGHSVWVMLARFLPAWLPYSQPAHVTGFLRWMFRSLSVSEEDEGDQNHKKIANALFQDASFLEMRPLASRILDVGLISVAEFLDVGFLVEEKGRKMLQKKVNASQLLRNPQSVQISTRELLKLTGKTSLRWKWDKKYTNTCASNFHRASSILQVLGSIGPLSVQPSRAESSFDLAFRLDILLGLIYQSREQASIKPDITSLLGSIRALEAKLVWQEPPSQCSALFEAINEVVEGVCISVTSISRDKKALETFSDQVYLESSCKFVESLAAWAASASPQTGTFLQELIGNLTRDVVNADDARIYLVRSIVNGALPGLDGKEDAEVLNHALTKVFSSLKEYSFPQGLALREVDGLKLLVSDALRHSSQVDVDEASKRLLVKFVQSVGSSMEHLSMDKLGSYMLASIATAGMDQDGHEFLTGYILSTHQSDGFLDSALCSMITRLQPPDIPAFLEDLLRRMEEGEPDARGKGLYAFRVFLGVANEDKREKLGSSARDFYSFALEQLYSSDGSQYWGSNVKCAARLIIELTKHKDVISLKERDVSTILAHIGAVLDRTRDPDQGVRPFQGGLFSTCNELVVALLHRFPKQICVCVPPFVSSVHALFKHLIHDPLDDEAIKSHAQEFSRLTDMMVPHSPYFKKHVLGMLLDFVSALGGTMTPFEKKVLAPAVYSLLDILSPFEMNQLNSLLDTPGKAVFRPFFDGYQKLHVYKGHY